MRSSQLWESELEIRRRTYLLSFKVRLPLRQQSGFPFPCPLLCPLLTFASNRSISHLDCYQGVSRPRADPAKPTQVTQRRTLIIPAKCSSGAAGLTGSGYRLYAQTVEAIHLW
jgi:hypothetical protein